jgi:hypothetical protein
MAKALGSPVTDAIVAVTEYEGPDRHIGGIFGGKQTHRFACVIKNNGGTASFHKAYSAKDWQGETNIKLFRPLFRSW